MLFSVNNSVYNISLTNKFFFHQEKDGFIEFTIDQDGKLINNTLDKKSFENFINELRENNFIIPIIQNNSSYFGFNYIPKMAFILKTSRENEEHSYFCYTNDIIIIKENVQNIQNIIQLSINSNFF
jgi:hypothetical protein